MVHSYRTAPHAHPPKNGVLFVTAISYNEILMAKTALIAGVLFSSWVVYWDLPQGLEQAGKTPVFHDLAVFCYRFNPDGKIVPSLPVLAGAVDKVRALAPAVRNP